MKKIKVTQKLRLNKETISEFRGINTANIKGGAPKSDYVECVSETKRYCTGYKCDTGVSNKERC